MRAASGPGKDLSGWNRRRYVSRDATNPLVNEELILKVSRKHIARERSATRAKAAKVTAQNRTWTSTILGACRSHSPFEKRRACEQRPLEKAEVYVKVAISKPDVRLAAGRGYFDGCKGRAESAPQDI
jgi:hypothetical protein